MRCAVTRFDGRLFSTLDAQRDVLLAVEEGPCVLGLVMIARAEVGVQRTPGNGAERFPEFRTAVSRTLALTAQFRRAEQKSRAILHHIIKCSKTLDHHICAQSARTTVCVVFVFPSSCALCLGIGFRCCTPPFCPFFRKLAGL